jgi:hypothetical protein
LTSAPSRSRRELDDDELDAINNIGTREQRNYGASLQFGLRSAGLGDANDLTLGVAYSEGHTKFHSDVEVAQLLEDRGTSRTGIYAADFVTDVDSAVTAASAYFADTLSLSDRLTLTLLADDV